MLQYEEGVKMLREAGIEMGDEDDLTLVFFFFYFGLSII